MPWFLLMVSISTTVAAQTLLKTGASRRDILYQLMDLHTLAGLVLYGIAALLYMIAIRSIPISIALPCTATSYVAVVIIGTYYFHEPVTWIHLAGVALICLGAVLLATG